MANELILHNYDFSNYAEKARLALGYKGVELAVRDNSARRSEARLDAVDRGLSPDTRFADRRGYLLRHEAYLAATRAASVAADTVP